VPIRVGAKLTGRQSDYNIGVFDNESRIAGVQSRFRWILHPGNDLLLVVNRGSYRTLDDSRFEPMFDRDSAKLQYNTDWWTAHYPASNAGRPTGPLCDGCHSVNYNVKTKDGHRVERRLREMPWARQRTRRAALARHHREPVAPGPHQRGERVHPVPFPGAPARQPRRGPVLRLAGRLSRGSELARLLAARGVHTR